MDQETINKFIVMPMAITVFKQDQERFKEFKLGNLYLDMLESIVERLHQDYFKLKAELIKVHHVDVKKIDVGKYMVNKEIIEFTPGELKELTRKIMSDYLSGDNATEFQRKERIWGME